MSADPHMKFCRPIETMKEMNRNSVGCLIDEYVSSETPYITVMKLLNFSGRFYVCFLVLIIGPI